MWIFLVEVSGNGQFGTQPTITPPPHRGAARQMYGSGSLRPPGTKPIYATGQRQHGIRTTLSPQLQNAHKIIPILQSPYQIFPVHFSFDEYRRTISNNNRNGGGYPPIFLDPALMQPPRQKTRITNRGGLYGGRHEYYNGKPPYNAHGTWQAGFLEGKGYGKDRTPAIGQYYTPRRQSDLIIRDRLDLPLKNPEEEDDAKPFDMNYKYEETCGGNCTKGRYLCIKSCMCIDEKYR